MEISLRPLWIYIFTEDILKRHLESLQNYPCESHLKTLVENKHKKVSYPWNPCNQCEYIETTTGRLKIHVKSKHEGVKNTNVITVKCVYAATTTNHLKKHVESKHEGVRYPCKHCEYNDTRIGSLKIHV